MLRLAGREADGAILNWLGPMTSRSVGPRSARKDDRGATLRRAHGRRRPRANDRATHDLVVPDGERLREFHRWLGRADALQPMWDAWARQSQTRERADPDWVVDELIIHGPYEACREHVLRYIEAASRFRRSPSSPSASTQRGRRGTGASLDLFGFEELQHARELLARRRGARGMNSVGTSLGV